jgi:hypothetical protein
MSALARIALALTVVALTAPGQAAAGSYDALLGDCPDGSVDGDYTRGQLNRALQNIPADSTEYGYCHDAIAAALAAGGSGGGSDPKPKSSQNDGAGADTDGDGVVTPREARAAKRRRDRAQDRRRAKLEALAEDPTAAGPALEVDDASDGASWPLMAGAIVVCAALAGALWLASRRIRSSET